MQEKEKLVSDIANHIRKIEELRVISHSVEKLLDNEIACLHQCLSEGAEVIGVKVPSGNAVVFGGGQPKVN